MREYDLDGVKLVYDDSYFAGQHEVDAHIEVLFQQASQGWGLRRLDAVQLAILRDFREAQALAVLADDRQRMLKGAQMENGRLKKQLAAVKAKLDATTAELAGAVAREIGSWPPPEASPTDPENE
jgi:hypothetical protein